MCLLSTIFLAWYVYCWQSQRGAWLLEKCSAVSVQYLTTCVLLGALDYAVCEHLFDLIHQQIVFFFT
jgi:hypothetical protein